MREEREKIVFSRLCETGGREEKGILNWKPGIVVREWRRQKAKSYSAWHLWLEESEVDGTNLDFGTLDVEGR